MASARSASHAEIRRGAVSPAALALVVVGGAVGVALRSLIVVPFAAAPHPLVVPGATLAINLLGSFLLGVIVGALADRHPRARLFLGTGVMGGFTTYSAFAVQSVTVSSASPYVGLALIAVSVFGGVVAAGIGLGAGRRVARRPDDDLDNPEDAE